MEGYAKIAQLMGRHDEFAMLRRFGALNMQNLLYMQAELTYLEEDLKNLACHDPQDVDKFFARDWWSLSQSENDEELTQWQKFLEIRGKLKEYNEAVLQQAKMKRLGSPTLHDIEALRSWLARPTLGNARLLGPDRNSYSTDNEKDIITLNAKSAPDVFSRWFTDVFIPKWHKMVWERFKKPTSEDLGCGMYNYEATLLSTILNITTTVVASLLPLCSVIMLYFAPSNALRLGLLVLVSALFSLALILMTNAKRIEVFAATSAFAAVNVAFLTNDSLNGPPS